MPVKRAAKERLRRITPEALAAFKRLRRERDGSGAWWQAHHALHDALLLPPWVFPFDGSADEPIYPLDARSETTGELWRKLEAMAKPVGLPAESTLRACTHNRAISGP